MALSHQVQFSISDGALRINAAATVNPTASSSVDETVATGATNELITVAVESTALKMFVLSSDQDVTIKTNSSGSPQETFTMKANKPLVWMDGSPSASPIAGDVTALYVTNASGSTANIKMLAGWTT